MPFEFTPKHILNHTLHMHGHVADGMLQMGYCGNGGALLLDVRLGAQHVLALVVRLLVQGVRVAGPRVEDLAVGTMHSELHSAVMKRPR